MFSAVYVYGSVRQNIRFSLIYGCIGGMCIFQLFICREFRIFGFQLIFSVLQVYSILIFEFGGMCIFRDITSNRYNNQAFLLQIAGLVLLESLIFFFYIVLLKIIKFTVSILFIFHYLSSNTYPLKPIFQNLSSRIYLPIDFV